MAYQSPVLGQKPRPVSISVIQLSATGYEPYSRSVTPVDGLNAAELKLLRKLFATGSKTVKVLRRVVEEYNGQADDVKLKYSVSRMLRNAVFSYLL